LPSTRRVRARVCANQPMNRRPSLEATNSTRPAPALRPALLRVRPTSERRPVR
jgi:hypothetical protein